MFRSVKSAIESEMEALDRRVSVPLPMTDMEQELTDIEAKARRLLGRTFEDHGSSSDMSLDGLDASSTQYLNLPHRHNQEWDNL